jgi:hypothetical protein
MVYSVQTQGTRQAEEASLRRGRNGTQAVAVPDPGSPCHLGAHSSFFLCCQNLAEFLLLSGLKFYYTRPVDSSRDNALI